MSTNTNTNAAPTATPDAATPTVAVGEEVFRVTQDNAKEFCAALGLGEPMIMADAEDMVWTRMEKK